jgi:4a-hydroxytetrahydrobiopterin dehydratase
MKLREIFENGGRIVKGVNTTVDVGPDEIKTQAAKFGNTVDKDGYPPTHKRKVKGSSTNVLFNLGEGKFRTDDVEEFKPGNDALNDMKSKYLPDWEMLDHKTLQAKYVAQDHREAEAFVRIINKLSEKMDHFCEVTQDVAEVAVKTTTFDVKGLTILDFQIAMVIDKFANDVGIKQTRMSGNFGMHENFADGKNPGRKGLAKRSGVDTKASVSSLRKTAKNSSGEKQRMAHWMANMKAGKKK